MEEWSVSGSAEHLTACRKQAVTPGIIDVILTIFYFFYRLILKISSISSSFRSFAEPLGPPVPT